jgi:hypothetical protein
MRHSYTNPNDVILLLKDMTGKVQPVSLEERKKRVENGEYVRSIIIEEYKISKEYIEIVNSYIDDYIENMAKYVGILAEKLYEVKGDKLVLVDIVRAGIPIGILIKKYIKKYYNIDIPHYGISLVQGLDPNAMKYIINKHGTDGIQFIDGWTGKGTVAKEIRESAKKYPNVDDSLACLSDCINQAKYVGTREDVYIPYSPLNASITGLVSITVKNENYSDENDFHAAIYLDNLENEDQSQDFIDRVSSKFQKQSTIEVVSNLKIDDTEIDKIATLLNKDKKELNPGINEAARAVLRRELEKLVVSDKNDIDLKALIKLAEYKNVPVVEIKELKGYKAVSVAKDNYIR